MKLSDDNSQLELAANSFLNAGLILDAALRDTIRYYRNKGNVDMQESLAALHRSFILLDSLKAFHGNIMRAVIRLDHLEHKSQSVISSGVQ